MTTTDNQNGVAAPAFTATSLGAPRIGPKRELKKAIESYWAGKIDKPALLKTAADLRRDMRNEMRDAGLDSVPTNTHSFYDQVLDATVMLGALPARYDVVDDELDRYFAAARGSAEVAPLEMTKWFDTNYHYLVPEIDDKTTFSLHADKVLDDLAEAVADGIPARPVVLGPVSYLKLAKATEGSGDPFGRVDELVPLYTDLLSSLRAGGAHWVQLDEPSLVTDLSDAELEKTKEIYGALSAETDRPAILVATYFGSADKAVRALGDTNIEGLAVDLVYGTIDAVNSSTAFHDRLVVAGVVDGRNVWRTDLDAAMGSLASVLGCAGQVAVSTSCSTLHVPYTLDAEEKLDPSVAEWLAFGSQKYAEVVTLAKALKDGRDSVAEVFDASRVALDRRAKDPRTNDSGVRAHVESVRATGATRGDAAARKAEQAERLGLPPLPTTTIGSYPQTPEIRKTRAAFRNGKIEEAEYVSAMREEIKRTIELQESLGIDVLVHGEPERNDMVQYFAELLDGFVTTEYGWVQSYGTRCVRPPILFGDVTRPKAMTVEWAKYAQSLTDKPVKGMLTGPVTILAWSFVRDDIPLADSSDQVALAIRSETVDLQSAGIRIVQVDEPALRELLPLRKADQQAYLDWSVRSFRIATSGVADSTQIHTHLCYSEFGEVIDSIAGLDADVTSIEAARSHMEVVADLESSGFSNQVGPGVYDIHSPRIPETDQIVTSLGEALDAVTADRLWVNPDCGLKTRKTDEVEKALANMVAAAKEVRAKLG